MVKHACLVVSHEYSNQLILLDRQGHRRSGYGEKPAEPFLRHGTFAQKSGT